MTIPTKHRPYSFGALAPGAGTAHGAELPDYGDPFRAASERAQKQFFRMVEMLVAAVYVKRGAATICSGQGGYGGGIWVEPQGNPLRVGEEHMPGIKELADEYHALTNIPPERCRVISRIVGFEWRVSFEERA
jgi:hypothetical protein